MRGPIGAAYENWPKVVRFGSAAGALTDVDSPEGVAVVISFAMSKSPRTLTPPTVKPCKCNCGCPAAINYTADGRINGVKDYADGHGPAAYGGKQRQPHRLKAPKKRPNHVCLALAAAWLGRPLDPMERVRPLTAIDGKPTGGFIIFRIGHRTRREREGAIVVTDPVLLPARSDLMMVRQLPPKPGVPVTVVAAERPLARRRPVLAPRPMPEDPT